MSRYSNQSCAPGMSSGRSRGSSLGQGGFSYTTQTKTVETTTTNTVHHPSDRSNYIDEYTYIDGGSSGAHGHLCMIDEEDYDSDSSDDTIVGHVSNMRLGGRTDSESTVRGPRLLELPDSRSRTSSRPSGSHYSSSSRPTDSHRQSTRGSSRPTDSHRRSTQTSSRPSESHYSTSRPAVSHRRSTLTSTRASESH